MALNAPADSAPASPPPTVPEPGASGPRPRRLLDTLYLAASSPQTTIALAVLLALTLAVAAALPQLPGGVGAPAVDRWLATASARYGRFGPLFTSSGLFNVLAGPWIVTLLALSALHLALRIANQSRRLVARPSGIPAAPQGLPFELVHLPLAVDAVRDRVAALEPGGAVVTNPSAPWPRVDAFFERRRWAAIGPLLMYLGPLFVVMGLLWNTVAGWRITDVTLIPGRTVQPAEAGGLALTLVTPSSPEDARPGVLALARGGQTRNAWLGSARPVRWGAVWIAQRSSGPALAVRATEGGKPLPVQPLEGDAAPADSLHLRFGQNESEQGFTIPGRNLAFRVVSYDSLAERGIDRPVFLVEGYQGADTTPALNELVEGSKTIEWQGASLTLQREAYVVVDLAAMPGLPLLLLGGLVLLAGVAVAAWAGLARTWLNAAADGDGTLLAVRVAAPALGQAEVSPGRCEPCCAGGGASRRVAPLDGVGQDDALRAWRRGRLCPGGRACAARRPGAAVAVMDSVRLCGDGAPGPGRAAGRRSPVALVCASWEPVERRDGSCPAGNAAELTQPAGRSGSQGEPGRVPAADGRDPAWERLGTVCVCVADQACCGSRCGCWRPGCSPAPTFMPRRGGAPCACLRGWPPILVMAAGRGRPRCLPGGLVDVHLVRRV